MLREPIVFISGWGVHASLLKENTYLERKITLIDLPWLTELTLESVVNCLLSQIPDESIILGWSLGGLIGIKLASQFPGKVKKLALISSSPRFVADANWPGIDKKYADRFLILAKKNFNNLFNCFLFLVNYPNKNSAFRNQLIRNAVDFKRDKNCLRNYLSILFEIDLRAEYSRLKIPLFHLFGEKDAIYKVDSKALSSLNKQSKIYSLPKAGHLPFLTHAREFYDRLMRFVNDD
ncbi:alpha/beta fold hydrolase [Coxiella endosymbiont of Ornithodoros amblus]|uniref:alpha/beta fold hydrolase n=1 Tax=Coxiella endosymbiont of Ornithodoros amblus TaxID=1656166 RepID=UPI00244E211F|nr:alpha/beta fold hydrolase [Coxiella endosymbiont of Ornithodoros amblus]MBW5803100.1 alpha/beta fold hydrolase [Coxiella endosymbiont of Ornithodoros amblus]